MYWGNTYHEVCENVQVVRYSKIYNLVLFNNYDRLKQFNVYMCNQHNKYFNFDKKQVWLIYNDNRKLM